MGTDRVFQPRPANTFASFIKTYYEECRQRVPGIEGIAGKWEFEDLIPGLSDFDTRLFVNDSFGDDDWIHMSEEVGNAHLVLCREFPKWARILEHLPGINLRWGEFGDKHTYYPEYRQWTIYASEDVAARTTAEQALADHDWSETDEYYFLKKFLTYYGPYDRKIDPAINLGPYESKYPLHSRFMHYFAPPVQAAMSIVRRRPIRGKMEALRMAADAFPDAPAFPRVFQAVERHYECPEWYIEPELTLIEDELLNALDLLRDVLANHLTLVDGSIRDTAHWKRDLGRIAISPVMRFLDSTRFARLFKGRLRFYVDAPPHFDNLWCIQNELRRAGHMFLREPLAIFAEVTGGECSDVDRCIDRLVPEITSVAEAAVLRRFAELAPGTWLPGTEIVTATRIADLFDTVFVVLSRLGRLILAEGYRDS